MFVFSVVRTNPRSVVYGLGRTAIEGVSARCRIG